MNEFDFKVTRDGTIARVDLGRPEAGKARFAFPEIEHDIPPTMAMCAALGKVPAKALTYLIYSAEQVDAEQAVTLRLASKVLPQASFAADADAFIKKLAARPRLVLETIKRYQRRRRT